MSKKDNEIFKIWPDIKVGEVFLGAASQDFKLLKITEEKYYILNQKVFVITNKFDKNTNWTPVEMIYTIEE